MQSLRFFKRVRIVDVICDDSRSFEKKKKRIKRRNELDLRAATASDTPDFFFFFLFSYSNLPRRILSKARIVCIYIRFATFREVYGGGGVRNILESAMMDRIGFQLESDYSCVE